MRRGFTLIETLVYLALLGLLMTGAIASLYSIEQSVDAERSGALIESEGDFVLAKIDWAVSHATSIAVPHAGKGSVLKVRTSDASDPIIVTLDGSGAVLMQEGGGDPVPLTTANVDGANLSFTPIIESTEVVGIDASFILDGVLFETRQHLIP